MHLGADVSVPARSGVMLPTGTTIYDVSWAVKASLYVCAPGIVFCMQQIYFSHYASGATTRTSAKIFIVIRQRTLGRNVCKDVDKQIFRNNERRRREGRKRCCCCYWWCCVASLSAAAATIAVNTNSRRTGRWLMRR